MKKKITITKTVSLGRILMFIAVIALSVSAFAIPDNHPTEVKKGERPPIDVSSIPDQAIEPGIIRIKFNSTLENYLDNTMFSSNPDGSVRFGISGIDQLNQQFGVVQIRKTFEATLQNTQYTSRHRLWGFHLWYDLIVPAGTDIRSMVMAYASKNEIEVSEPVYKKQLIGADINPVKTQSTGNIGADPAGDAGLNYVPNDPRYNEQWHYHNTGQQSGTVDADIDLPEAWDITKGNNSVVVAVIDEGISYTHTDLAANMWPGNGYNFVTNTSTISPGDHGTHVAGTIAANTNNGTGVSGIAGGTGTGNGVRLMSCQVFTTSSSGGFENAPIWAADHGAAISQNSWGYTSVGYYEQVVLDAIDYFNANGGGTVLNGGITIFAAGNSSSSGQWYPGYYSGTFSVAATNNQDIKAWYSNYDTWVDISAPGGETDAVAARGVLSSLTGNTYGFYQGTSMACPHVSGVAALILSLAPGVLTPQDLKNILTTTTDNIYPLNPTYTGKLGSGRLNAYQALLTAQGYVNPLLPAAPVSLTATAVSTSQINLTWAPNAANDVVMLAYNTTNTFGVPTGNYTPGQTISGGGTILYEGTLTSFQHLSLNTATPYYYSLWSKNGGYYSAVSRKASATTLCGTISTFPWTEGFENGGVIPNCWTQEQVASSGIDWTFITGNGGSNPASAHTGTYNACLKDASSASNLTKLITPPINLTGVTGPTLTFWHTQAFWSPDQDQLIVYYRTSTAGPWVSLATYTASVTAWTQRTISLPAASGNYYIAFEGNAKYGYGACVDDVSISGTATPTLSVTPANQNVSPAAGSTTFAITSNSAWTASSNQTWCTVTSSGSGNGTITATYAANNTASARVANVTVNVTGLSPVVVTVTQAAPALSVGPSNQGVSPTAGSTNFSVTSNTGWTASSNQTWCTVTPSGSGNGTITATYTVNNTASARVANVTVTVTGLSPVVVTVTQSAPALSVSPSNQSVSATAGSTDFSVTTNTNWTAASNQTWCTVTPSGTGSGILTATFSQNNTTSQRVANITVSVNGLSPVVATVTQAGLIPTLAVTPANQNVSSAAGSTAFTVTSNSSWTAISDQTWCTATPAGSGNGIITASFVQNPTTNLRIANITATAEGLSPLIVTVTQAGASSPEFVTTIQNVVQTSANRLEFDIYLLDSDVEEQFALAGYQAGIYINPDIFPAGASISAGILSPGTGTYSDLVPGQRPLNILYESSTNIIQLAGRVPPGPGTVTGPDTYTPNGTVISTTGFGSRVCRIRITSSIPYISNSQPNLGFQSFDVTVPLYATRVSHYDDTNMLIVLDNLNEEWTWSPLFGGAPPLNVQLDVIAGYNANVFGNPYLNPPPTLNVTPDNQIVDYHSGTASYAVTSNTGWTANSDQTWCAVTGSGFGNGNILADFSENNTNQQRTVNITVTVNGLPQVVVTLTQEGTPEKVLNLSLLMEGLYGAAGMMNPAMNTTGAQWGNDIADLITLEFHDQYNYGTIVHSVANVNLFTNGNASITFPAVFNGNYYLTVRHRNSIETVSFEPISFNAQTTTFNFDHPSKVFGNNLKQLYDGSYVIFGGDVNQDGTIDIGDMTPVDNDASNFSTGYLTSDVNGDGTIDTADMTIIDNNATTFTGADLP